MRYAIRIFSERWLTYNGHRAWASDFTKAMSQNCHYINRWCLCAQQSTMTWANKLSKDYHTFYGCMRPIGWFLFLLFLLFTIRQSIYLCNSSSSMCKSNSIHIRAFHVCLDSRRAKQTFSLCPFIRFCCIRRTLGDNLSPEKKNY